MPKKRLLSDRNRRKFLKAVGVITGGAAMAGCLGDDNGDDDVATADDDDSAVTDDDDDAEPTQLRISLGENPTGMDPHLALGATNEIVRQSYEFLLQIDDDGNLVPHLAEDWENLEPGHDRVYLRDDVYFHSGSQMTPEDVAYSLRRVMHEDVGGIAAAQEITGVESVEAVPEENAVDLFSDGMNTQVFREISNAGDIVEEEWIEERDSDEVQVEANGTGPYRLEEWDEGVRAIFTRFDDYWRGPAEIEEVRITWAEEASTRISQLIADEVDFITNVPADDVDRIMEQDHLRVEAQATNRLMYSQFPVGQEPVESRELRLALNYAIDQQAVIDGLLAGFGEPLSQLSLPHFFGYNEELDPFPYDPERAEELIEESGRAGEELELHHSVGRYLQDEAVAQVYANQIDSLPNISCEAVSREWSSFVSEIADGDLTTNPMMSQLGAISEQMDSAAFLSQFFACGQPLSGWCNEEVDGLLAEARAEVDVNSREELLKEANRILREDPPALMQHQIFAIWAVNERLDWEPSPNEFIIAFDMSLNE